MAYVLALGYFEGCCEILDIMAFEELDSLEHAKRVKAEIEAGERFSSVVVLMVSEEVPSVRKKAFHYVSLKEFMDIFVWGFHPPWYYGFEPKNYAVDVNYKEES